MSWRGAGAAGSVRFRAAPGLDLAALSAALPSATGVVEVSPGSYRVGWTRTRDGESDMNRAPGLQEPTEGESGIQGLSSASVARADMYSFAAGSLAPQVLRVVVVQLTPGTAWRGR